MLATRPRTADQHERRLAPERVPLVGRQRELDAILGALASARRGAGGLALVAGEPGIGKTRLLEELVQTAADCGMRPLWGRSLETPGAPAFWPWRPILRGAIEGADPGRVCARLGPSAADLAALVPGLCLPNAAPRPFDSPEDRFRLFESVAHLLSLVAEDAPLLVVLDDLHWADPSSLLLLEFVAHAGQEVPMLLVGSFRDVAVDSVHPLARTLGQLARVPRQQRVLLRPLGVTDVEELIAHVAGAPPARDLAEAVCRRSEGNAFYVAEILLFMLREQADELRSHHGEWHLPIPPSVTDVIGLRLATVSAPSRRLLQLASVVGREFSIAALELASQESIPTMLELLAEAEGGHLLAACPEVVGAYRFTHALTRETLYAEIPQARRPLFHRRVAEALERLWRDDPDRAAELAYHFTQAAPAGEPTRALEYARRAAERALEQHAYEESVLHFQSALRVLDQLPDSDLAPRCELLVALGQAQLRAGDASGRRSLWQAADLARRLCQRNRSDVGAPLLARAALAIGGLMLSPGQPTDQLARLLEQALAALGDADGPLRAQLLSRLAAELQDDEELPRRDALSHEAVAIARRAGDSRALAIALMGRTIALRGPDHLSEVLAASEESVRLASAAGDAHLALWAYRLQLLSHLDLGDLAAARRDREAHAQLAARLRDPHHQLLQTAWRATWALLDGSLAEAEALAHQTVSQGRGSAEVASLYAVVQFSAIREELGDVEEFMEAWRDAPARFAGAPVLEPAFALLDLVRGREQEARQAYEQLVNLAFPRTGQWLAVQTHLARLCIAFEDRSRARALYERLRPYVGRHVVAMPALAAYGSVSHYLGLLADADLDWDAAERHFERALEDHARWGARLWLARTRQAYAKSLMRRVEHEGARVSVQERQRTSARARQHADEAFSLATVLGASRLAHDAKQLRSRDGGAALPSGLTAREAEVLRLVADGRSNREIAEALVLTVNTVQSHVQHIYTKTDARSRADAVAFAFRHGIAGH